jgi:hypothetical protein
MTKPAHSCLHHGHVWLEANGTPYTRHRGRSQASVTVACQYCPATATLPAIAKHTAPPQQPPHPAVSGKALAAIQSRIALLGSVPKHP